MLTNTTPFSLLYNTKLGRLDIKNGVKNGALLLCEADTYAFCLVCSAFEWNVDPLRSVSATFLPSVKWGTPQISPWSSPPPSLNAETTLLKMFQYWRARAMDALASAKLRVTGEGTFASNKAALDKATSSAIAKAVPATLTNRMAAVRACLTDEAMVIVRALCKADTAAVELEAGLADFMADFMGDISISEPVQTAPQLQRAHAHLGAGDILAAPVPGPQLTNYPTAGPTGPRRAFGRGGIGGRGRGTNGGNNAGRENRNLGAPSAAHSHPPQVPLYPTTMHVTHGNTSIANPCPSFMPNPGRGSKRARADPTRPPLTAPSHQATPPPPSAAFKFQTMREDAPGRRLEATATQPAIKPCSQGATLALLYFPLGFGALNYILLTQRIGEMPTGIYACHVCVSLMTYLGYIMLSVGGHVVSQLHTALVYWPNFNSQPSHAHVRCLLYALGVPLLLVHAVTPIVIIFVSMVTCALSLTMRLLTNGLNEKSTTWALAIAAPLLGLTLALWTGGSHATSTSVQRPQVHLLSNSTSTAAALNLGLDQWAAQERPSVRPASWNLSVGPDNKIEAYTAAAVSYIGAKRAYLRLIGARRWGLSARLDRQVRRQVWNLDHERAPSGSVARLLNYLQRHQSKCRRLLPKGKQPHTPAPAPPVRVGGANHKQRQSEKERTAQLLADHHNLQPVHSYRYIVGDCFFDCMEYLTGVPSLAIRELAMLMWRHAMSKSVDTAVATAVHIATNHVGQGRSMNPEDYITQMTKSAAAGGLWADSSAVTLSYKR